MCRRVLGLGSLDVADFRRSFDVEKNVFDEESVLIKLVIRTKFVHGVPPYL